VREAQPNAPKILIGPAACFSFASVRLRESWLDFSLAFACIQGPGPLNAPA